MCRTQRGPARSEESQFFERVGSGSRVQEPCLHFQLRYFPCHDEPAVAALLYGGRTVRNGWLRVFLPGKFPGLVSKSLSADSIESGQSIPLVESPTDLFTRVQEIRDLGHCVPAETSLRCELRGEFHPVLNLLAIWQNSRRVKIEQPRLLAVGDECGQRLEPLLDDRKGNVLGAQFLERGGPIHLRDGDAQIFLPVRRPPR